MSEDKTIYLWNVFCISEQKMVQIWSPDPPTLCPNNHANRELDTSLNTIVNSVSTKKVNIEDASPGYYQQTTLKLSVPSGNVGDVSSFDFSWPTDIYIMKTQFMPNAIHLLDEISVVGGPNTLIGAIIQPASAGTQDIYITPATFDSSYISNGIDITINGGGNSEDKLIKTLDKTNFKFKLSTPLTHAYNPGTLIYMNLYIIKNVVVSNDKIPIESGTKGIQNKFLPAGTILRFFYKNNSIHAKDVYILFDYKYL